MKKRRKKKISIKRFFILIMIAFLSLYICKHKNLFSIRNIGASHSKYSIMKQDTNSRYAGIGQEKVKNQDGYFTTFTTVEKQKKIYKEYKQNGLSSWSQHAYWGGTMSDNGCGITALATILSGYGQDYTPETLRQKYYPVLDYATISKELSKTFGIDNTDFYYDSTHLSKVKLKEHLETNKPILICVWNKPTDNRWTSSSHYMALLATDGDDKIYVSNPNGGENDSKSSGWYPFDEIVPYLAKALYIET